MHAIRKLSAIVALVPTLMLGAKGLAQSENNTITEAEFDAGWQLLFNGANLDGWTPTGNPIAWVAEDGMIQCRPGGGGWLRTVDQYRDFELYVDFKIGPGGNSGLGLRASSTGDPAFTGMEIQIYDTYGQEPRKNGCGAVYNAIAPRVQAVNKAGEWNTYHVLLVGDVLNVWLNGEHIHVDEKLDGRGIVHREEDKCPLESRAKSGYIALQDHGDGAYFRNIKIRPIEVFALDRVPDGGEDRWYDLFNGRNLDGWFAKGDATWSVEDGQLVGRDGVGHLYTNDTFENFELRAKVWIKASGNSGLYFRAHPPEANPDSWPDGYEAQVDNHDPKNFTGSLYARAWPEELITKDEEWFDYHVRCVGNHIWIAINGQTMLETDHDDFRSAGHIALQGHNPGSEVRWRDIQVRELPESNPMFKQVVRVFYSTHSAGYKHGVLPFSREVMDQLDQENDWLHVQSSDNIADLTPAVLANTDVVMFYTTGELPMTDEQKDALVKFCAKGGGFVGVHSATDTFYQWPWYCELIGANFNGHPWHEEVTVEEVDPLHPAMLPWGRDGTFKINDEIYMFKNRTTDRHILMRLDPKATADKGGGIFPEIAWTKVTKLGRAFYTSLGHEADVWRDTRFQQHLLAGIKWAANNPDAGDVLRSMRSGERR